MVHSYFIAVIKPWAKEFPASKLIGLGRLGTKVKKNTLLCSVKPDTNRVVYQTLQWSGWT